jgi:molybdate-binding protein
MFPESINSFRLRRARLENFLDFVKAGKESYYIVSKFEHFEYAKVAPLFASLSRNFEECVYGLNRVKNELEEMQHPIVGRGQELLM